VVLEMFWKPNAVKTLTNKKGRCLVAKVNKSEVIRAAVDANPDVTFSDVKADMESKGITAGNFAAVKSGYLKSRKGGEQSQKGKRGRKAKAKPSANGSTVDYTAAVTFVREQGGIAKALASIERQQALVSAVQGIADLA